MIRAASVMVAFLISMPSVMAMRVPSLRSKALKICAQCCANDIKQKLKHLPADLYVPFAQEIILNNNTLSRGELVDILSHMKMALHHSILKPKPSDLLIINLFVAAVIADKQDIRELLEKVSIDTYLTTAFALMFKNETMSIADKIEILNQMLLNPVFKKTKDSEIIAFLAGFLTTNHEYLAGKKQILIEQNTNTVLDLRQSGEGTFTLLQEALLARNIPAIHFLLEHQANPNLTFDASLLPISYAAEYGLDDIIVDLIAHGAQLQPVNQYKTPYYDPLFRAAQNGHEETVKLLLQKGAQINKIFHTWDWGYGTLLDQIIGMKKDNGTNHTNLERAYTLFRKHGAKTLNELERKEP